MSIVDRVKNICFSPSTEWSVIAQEPAQAGSLLAGYVAPLAAIGAVAGFVGGSIIGRTLPFVGTFRVGIIPGLIGACLTLVMAIVSVGIVALIINALAPTFGAERDGMQALKVAAYSYTPAWLAGVLNVLPLVGLLVFFAALYGIYLMYLGLPKVMKCPPDKAIGYTAVVVVCAVVLSIAVSAVGAAVTGVGLLTSGALTSGALSGATVGRPTSREVEFDKNSPLGKLQDLSRKLEESGKKMDAAQKAGDASGQAAAAIETLGTLFGGGKRVEPIGIEELKPFVPPTFAGLPRTSSTAEKTGVAGLMVSKAEATYGEPGRRVKLSISDTGGVSGLVALAGWAAVQEEKEDEGGFERTRKVDGRLVHEKMSKRGGTNEYGIVLGDRFMVDAESSDLDLNTLKSAVASIDLARLESMKDAGVQK